MKLDMYKKMIKGVLALSLLLFTSQGWSQEQETKKLSIDEISEQDDVNEIKYVTDKLRLSLYKQASDKSGTIKLLVSGNVLGILERKGPYSKVRTEEGKVGWVKNGFLLKTPTANFLLLEEQKKNKILASQIEKFADTKSLVDDYENTISKINEDLETSQNDLASTTHQVEQLSRDNVELSEKIESIEKGELGWSEIRQVLTQFWYLTVLALILIFATGFMVGKELVEAQVRKRFQGVKVW